MKVTKLDPERREALTEASFLVYRWNPIEMRAEYFSTTRTAWLASKVGKNSLLNLSNQVVSYKETWCEPILEYQVEEDGQ